MGCSGAVSEEFVFDMSTGGLKDWSDNALFEPAVCQATIEASKLVSLSSVSVLLISMSIDSAGQEVVTTLKGSAGRGRSAHHLGRSLPSASRPRTHRPPR
jgi:hypothetical protein